MATSSTDPVRRAVEKVAASDSDREITVNRTTLRAELPLPNGRTASVELSRDTAKISRLSKDES